MMGPKDTEELDKDRSSDGVRVRYGSVQETGEGVHERHKPLTQRH